MGLGSYLLLTAQAFTNMKWKKDSCLVYASSTDECHNLGCRASEDSIKLTATPLVLTWWCRSLDVMPGVLLKFWIYILVGKWPDTSVRKLIKKKNCELDKSCHHTNTGLSNSATQHRVMGTRQAEVSCNCFPFSHDTWKMLHLSFHIPAFSFVVFVTKSLLQEFISCSFLFYTAQSER